jgi:transposase
MLIFWDGSGVCRVAKRLEDGEFHWPRVQDGAISDGSTVLSAVRGIGLEMRYRPKRQLGKAN